MKIVGIVTQAMTAATRGHILGQFEEEEAGEGEAEAPVDLGKCTNDLQVYYPRCKVAFDEMMVRFKGRVEFVHQKQRKPTGNGKNIDAVYESLTGYTYAFKIDQRNEKTIEQFVLDITEKLKPCYHKLIMSWCC